MVRRIASQVHQQTSRLLRGGVLTKVPAWYNAVLAHPPLPLPPKAPSARDAYDLPHQTQTSLRPKPFQARPLPIYYVEDDLRRQFYRDHPFEAFRPKTLAEQGGIEEAHPISGKLWTRLRQRGRNPSPEDAIRFAVNLHQHHGISLSQSYARAVAQFRALRSEHHISTSIAVLEAEQLGGTFSKSEITQGFEKEIKNLVTWERDAELDEGILAARKRWRAVPQDHNMPRRWTKGEHYVRLWREGIRPSYAPAITDTIIPPRDSPS